MNTLHLIYAVEIERTGSITQAADVLFITQPNLSKAIKTLENTLGIIIFNRTSKGMIPTQKGAEFLVYAKSILEQLNQMNQLKNPESAKKQSFKISIPCGSYITKGLVRFIAELNLIEMEIQIRETNTLQAIGNIVDEKFHFAIIRFHVAHESDVLRYVEEKKLRFEPILEYEYLALMSIAHPLAMVPIVQRSELSQFIEIVQGDAPVPCLPACRSKTNGNPKQILVQERCSQLEMLSRIPQTFMWVSPIPEELLVHYKLIQRKCGGTNSRFKDVLVYPKEYKLTAPDHTFIDILLASKNDMALKQYY